MENEQDNTSKRGFASMDPQKQRDIASQGGKAAHESGNAHEFEEGSQEAREAGRKGGKASHANRGMVEDEEFEDDGMAEEMEE